MNIAEHNTETKDVADLLLLLLLRRACETCGDVRMAVGLWYGVSVLVASGDCLVMRDCVCAQLAWLDLATSTWLERSPEAAAARCL